MAGKVKKDRSLENFKNRLAQASTVEIQNKTGKQEVPVISAGSKCFVVDIDGNHITVHYPKAGYARIINEGKVNFLKSFNGETHLSIILKKKTTGGSFPAFENYPSEEEEYGRKKKVA